MKLISLIIFTILFTFVSSQLIKLESPTFDEPVHLKAGLEYQKGNFNFDPIEPPMLRRVAVYLSHDLNDIRLLFSFLFALLVGYLIIYQLSLSFVENLVALSVFLIEPNILAFSHYFTTDAISSILCVITLYRLFSHKYVTPKDKFETICFFALTCASKIATLPLLFIGLTTQFRLMDKRFMFYLLFSTFLFVYGTYNFKHDLVFASRPFEIPFGGYLRGIKENALFAKRGQEVFFMGTSFDQGPWYKSILVLFLKTSPLVLLGLIFIRSSKPLLAIAGLSLLFNSLKSLQFGTRHLLPAVIAITILGSVSLWRRSKLTYFSLFTLSIISFFALWPHPITYTNALAGKVAPYALTDSDFDWGQGLISLNKFIKQNHIEHFQLAYFGNADTSLYLGPHWRLIDENGSSNLPISEITNLPTFISLTCYYKCGYYLSQLWPLQKSTLVAGSFLYFAMPAY